MNDIRLGFSKLFKYAAKDYDGLWVAYMEKPKYNDTMWQVEGDSFFGINTLTNFPSCFAKDSLHKIIHNDDGTISLRKYVEIPADGEPVIVWDDDDDSFTRKRYSTGKLTQRGSLICYDSGCTKWTAEEAICPWANWRSPTPEELI